MLYYEYLLKHPEENKNITQQSSKNLNWIYFSLPILVTIGLLTYIEVERKKKHIGLMQEKRGYNIVDLGNYVSTNLRNGYSKEQIKNALIKNNYNNQEIEEAFERIK